MAVRRKAGATRKISQQQPVDWQARARVLATLGIILLILAGSFYIQREDTLPVLHVSVEGDIEHTDRKLLQEKVKPYVTGSFINVDVSGIRRAASELPWIDTIQVRRVWPDTLHLVVTEHKAIARWNANGLVNNRGEVFYPPLQTIPNGLVQLNGPDGSSELMARRLAAMQQDLNTLNLKVRSLSMDKRRSWKMVFTDDLQLRLGRADSDARLQRFIRVFDNQLAGYREKIHTVDMRYTNGLAVQWKTGQQPDFNGTV